MRGLVVIGLLIAGSLWNDAAAAGERPAREGGRQRRLASERLGCKLGVQSYSFNRFTFLEAIEKAKAAGVRYIEAYPGQKLGGDFKEAMGTNLSKETQDALKKKLEEAGIKLVAFGVTGLGNEQEIRKTFEFAKAMGIEVVNSEPDEKLLPLIDKLAAEFDVKVGLHNHPKDSHYWNPDTVLAAVKGCSNRIGSCADTGHWMRSGLDPIECLKKLEGRIVAFHLKDLNERARDAHDVPWGTGKANVEAIMKEMVRQKFQGPVSIEYEYNWDNSVPEITQCVQYFEKQARALLPPRAGRRGGAEGEAKKEGEK